LRERVGVRGITSMDKVQLIDTHAHLDDPRFDGDRDDVIKRAVDAGVKTIINVGCWSKKGGFEKVAGIVKNNESIYCALGVHPHDAKDVSDNAPYDLIKKLAAESKYGGKVVAVGEAGLGYHYDNSPKDKQKEVFASQITLARALNLPLVIHSREAEKDTFDALKANGAHEVGGVFHCFSGDVKAAREALDLGFYISFTGVVTFPKAESIRDAVKYVPIEKTLIETDCPYLTPAPMRGERNEPAYVVNTAAAIAGLKGLNLEDVARITTRNAEELFGIGFGAGDKQEARIAYPIRNSLYLNITNRCSNYCTFCAKHKSYTVKGHYLRLREEPDFSAVIRAIGDNPMKYDEVVFCGFGEPLIRLDLVKKVGLHLKRMGCRIRIDTDGLANLVHKRNVLPELTFVDVISVSLNAPDSGTYQKIIKTPFGDASYPAILFFLREARKYIAKVVASVVTAPGIDVEACRKVAEDELGVAFRVREYESVG